MRLLHVVPTYLPATRYGGPIFAVHGLCRALRARGHSVEVFTTNVDGTSVSPVRTGIPMSLDGVEVTYFPLVAGTSWRSARRLYFAPSLKTAVRQRIASFDIVHLHSVFLWPTLTAARIARLAGVPYLVSPRGMLVPELVRRKSPMIKKLWLRAFERRTLREAAGIHFTSQREWDDAERMRLPLPFPFVVPNGIDLPIPADVPLKPQQLLFLGRINWKKRLELAIAALALVPDARLVIAGNDEEELTPRLRGEAARAGVSARVEFRGPVHGPEKDTLLRESVALILPSFSENFGNAVLEAMAVGTPAVVTPAVGIAAELASAGAGIVAEGNPRALADAMRRLLYDRATRAEMGRLGRAAVERRFTWPAVAAEMEAHYERILR